MKIKNSILSGIIFSGTSLFCYLGFAAYTNLATQVDGAIITKDIWNDVINKINTIGGTYAPTGMVSAFYGSSCPTGRNAADGSGDEPKTDGTLGNLDLRGEFIRGLDSGRGVDTGRILGSWQKPSIFTYHSDNNTSAILTSPSDIGDNSYNIYGVEKPSLNGYSSQSLTRAESVASSSYTLSVTSNDNYYKVIRPRNIALLYCIKQ
ncbi:MAG: hypothetical protein PHR68_02465 [Candidatus Gracilibacteria bacterium]|nr:hypothetical protein [Candidatus Gracilibacteria bacterium]